MRAKERMGGLADRARRGRVVVGAVALGAVASGWVAHRHALPPRVGATWDVTIPWIVGVVMLGALAAVDDERLRPSALRARAGRWVRRARRPSPVGVAAAWVLALAVLVRTVVLWRFPTVVDSDEANIVLTGVAARSGHLPDPWGTSFQSAPDLYRAWQGWLAVPFGHGIGAYRAMSALMGVVGVVATWRLGRRLLGAVGGVAAAAVLAVLPLHLWASRSGLNNISNAAVLPVVLLFTDRALRGGRRVDPLVAGAAAGIGLYTYYPAYLFGPLLLGLVALAVVLPTWSVGVRAGATVAGWAALAYGVVVAPIAATFVTHPEVLRARFTLVDATGPAPSVGQRAAWAWRGATFTLREVTKDDQFFRIGGPFLGWVVGPLALAGVVAWVAWLLRRRPGAPRPELLLATWAVFTIGTAQTQSMASQRWLAVTPFWALAAATGAVALVRLAARTPVPPRAVAGVVGAAFAVTSLVTTARWFSEDQQLRGYGDQRTTAAWDLGWRLARSPATKVWSVGLPALPFSGFANLRFAVPDITERLTEVEPFDGTFRAPKLRGHAVAAVAFVRDLDQCQITLINRGVRELEVRDRYGQLLYTAVVRHRADLTAATSPAGTTARWVHRCPS